jgi:hypothetical protein
LFQSAGGHAVLGWLSISRGNPGPNEVPGAGTSSVGKGEGTGWDGRLDVLPTQQGS